MLNKEKHKFILVSILKEIHSDPALRNILGFKGGTAAFLFYGLPRISIDLDFDVLDDKKLLLIFEKVRKILSPFGNLEQAIEKRYTLFFLLSYAKGERKVKVEISKRKTISSFELKNYLGIPVLVMKKEDMIAGKLSALLTRKRLASRDLFDLLFFLKQGWRINEEVLKQKTNFSLLHALNKAIKIVEKIPENKILNGMGELLNSGQKKSVKETLKNDLIFQIRLYLETRK
ncbi:nucleotidyl transferase AbiEii/AbiGii toxin family protein [Candidatus Microgenomates bacterium]|nr:nucleotidyl transferase AbiEii/AbiGii toxin family protein [Candidatus Microgenomates bacterium]